MKRATPKDTGEAPAPRPGRPPAVMRRTDSLTPYAGNARTHSREQVAQIASSILEFGFVNPVLVDAEGGIIAGHGRVLAAASIGMEEVPTLDIVWLTPAQRRAYILADNKLALNAGWDEERLSSELREIAALGVDLPVIGFSDAELSRLLEEYQAGADDTPDKGAGGIAYREQFAVVVQCDGEKEQRDTYEALLGLGYTCKVLVN